MSRLTGEGPGDFTGVLVNTTLGCMFRVLSMGAKWFWSKVGELELLANGGTGDGVEDGEDAEEEHRENVVDFCCSSCTLLLPLDASSHGVASDH